MTTRDDIRTILENFNPDRPVDVTRYCGSAGGDDGNFRAHAKKLGYRVSTRYRSATMTLVGVTKL